MVAGTHWFLPQLQAARSEIFWEVPRNSWASARPKPSHPSSDTSPDWLRQIPWTAEAGLH